MELLGACLIDLVMMASRIWPVELEQDLPLEFISCVILSDS